MPLTRQKTFTTGLTPGGNAPLFPPTAVLPPKGWQRNWIYREAQRPENPVTCFPVEKRFTTFCTSLTLLQNVFAVHPGGGGSLIAAQPLTS